MTVGMNRGKREGRYFSRQAVATVAAPHMDGAGGWVTVRIGDLNPDRRGGRGKCTMKMKERGRWRCSGRAGGEQLWIA